MRLPSHAGDERRVVVTGMGIVCPIGETTGEFFHALVNGRSGITHWKNMDERIDSKIGGDMTDFDLAAHFGRVGKCYPASLVENAQVIMRSTPISGNLAAAVAVQAYVDAGLGDSQIAPERFGVVMGGGNLNQGYSYQNALMFVKDPDDIEPLYGIHFQDTDVTSKVSELLTLKGPAWSVAAACATGNFVVLSALDLLRMGRADAVLCFSPSAGIDPLVLHGWAIVGAISTESFNDEPWRASRPFDIRREGFVPAHGGGALVLETLAGARARGAPIYAEVLGAGVSSDATRFTKPFVDGEVRAIRAALDDARVNPADVDYVNAHGTSTPIGDAVEVEAIKTVFGGHAREIPVNATKSMVGHCLTAAGIVELIATILEMRHHVIHPTINLEEPDPALDLDFVPNQARDYDMGIAISNSFGFGGLNSCCVVAQPP